MVCFLPNIGLVFSCCLLTEIAGKGTISTESLKKLSEIFVKVFGTISSSLVFSLYLLVAIKLEILLPEAVFEVCYMKISYLINPLPL